MFSINNVNWDIVFVNPNHPILYDAYNDVMSVTTTDRLTHCIYISNDVNTYFLYKILKHELVHCYLMSINYCVPIDIEEFFANLFATHSEELLNIAYQLWCDLQ